MSFDFTNNTQVEDINTVPEDFRAFYAEREGEEAGFVLKETPEVKAAIGALTGTFTALKASRNDAKKAKASQVDLTALSEYGTNPEEIKSWVEAKIEELSSKSKKTPDDKKAVKDLEQMRSDLTRAHEAEKITLKDENTSLLGQFNTLLRTNGINEAIAETKADPLLMDHLLKETVVQKDGDTVKVFVIDPSTLDDDGKPKIRYNGTGNPMSILERAKMMKDDKKFAIFFPSEAPKGSGHKPGMGQVHQTFQTDAKLSPTQKIAAGIRKRSRI